MSDDGWITEPGAIDTLVALQGILPGDEIRIKDAGAYNIDCRHEGVVGLVLAPGPTGHQVGEPSQGGCKYARHKVAARVRVGSGDWVVCRKNIAAWRRPGALKK